MVVCGLDVETEGGIIDSTLADQATPENDAGAPCRNPNSDPRASRRRLTEAASSRASSTSTSYAAYIKSDAWRFSPARLAELLASGARCRICNDGRSTTILHVHHRTYERLGCELVEDLTTLCEECHDVVTVSERRRANAGRALPVPLDLPKATACRMLVDSREAGR